VRRSLLAGALAGAVLLTAPAWADSRADFEKARASFLARNWADAEERLRALLDPKSGVRERALISQARMYLGALLLGQGKPDDAKEFFRQLALEDPTFDPDPLSFPGDAINMFIDVRSGLQEEIRKAREEAARKEAERKQREAAEREAQRVWFEKVKHQASEEEVTVRHSRIVACIPFGVGQFQNGRPILGVGFLAVQVAALAGTAVTYGMFRYARDRESDELTAFNRLASQQWHTRAEDLRYVNLGFVAGFLAAAGIGIAQANIAFVPEAAEKRKRELPPLVVGSGKTAREQTATPLAPIVTPLSGENGAPNGVFVGVSGVLF
jgi:hypothetical protein